MDPLTWVRASAAAAIEAECFRRDRMSPADEIAAAVAAALAKEEREVFSSGDIDRIAAAVLDRPITFDTPKAPTAKADAPTKTVVTKEPTPTGFRLTIRSLA
jgi:hypothetical protein